MPHLCPDCGQVYPVFVDFCVTDGARLTRVPSSDEGNAMTPPGGVEPAASHATGPAPPGRPDERGPRARLVPKVRGERLGDGLEVFGSVVLGRFDPKVGAVDVDLTGIPGTHTIAERHARLVFEGGRWFVEDLESENGVFINRGPRIRERAALHSGDELALGNALFVFEDERAGGESDEGDGGAQA